MGVLSLAIKAATAPIEDVPCRSQNADLWFAEDAVSTSSAQQLCQGCPLKTACLAGALERKEPVGVWGGELFDQGRIVAGHKPKGRPRNDADEVAAQAAARVARRLSEMSVALADTEPDLADMVAQAADVVGAA